MSACVDCGVPIPRTGRRGRPLKRCEKCKASRPKIPKDRVCKCGEPVTYSRGPAVCRRCRAQHRGESYRRWRERNPDTYERRKKRDRRRRKGTIYGRKLHIKKHAKIRGIAFELTPAQFSTFWQKPCFYCGEPIAMIGLDRIDSSQGYVWGNVLPCCTRCNCAKNTQTVAEYVERCAAVARRLACI